MFYLYKIVNSKNDKVYVGVTSRPKLRFKEHMSKNSSCTKLRRAISKYGKENFRMEILCIGEEHYILDLEPKAIQLYDSVKNGYNLMDKHPNENFIVHSEESKANISKALNNYYANNTSKNLGATRTSKHDIPTYISGFWFPTVRFALPLLRMNVKTFYKRIKDNTLGEVFIPSGKIKYFNPVYVFGFWFDSSLTASDKTGRKLEDIQHMVRVGDVEQELKFVGSKPRTKEKGINFGVNQRENGNFRSVFYQNKVKVFDKTFKNLQEALSAYDDCYEEIHNSRPNKTVKGAIP